LDPVEMSRSHRVCAHRIPAITSSDVDSEDPQVDAAVVAVTNGLSTTVTANGGKQ
jgi:hypothetical protein